MKILAIIGFMFLSLTVWANDAYIAQTAQGSNNGSNCANAYAVSYFNGSGNWTSGTPSGTQIGPGTTVHLCGTFTDSSGGTSTLLTFQGSGTSGNPIILHFETGAILTSTAWYWAGAINSGGHSYFTVDGGTNGIIQNTANGTAGGACQNGSCNVQQDSRFVYISNTTGGVSNVEVKNLTMYDPYVHTPNANDDFITEGNAECVTALDDSYITVDNNTCRNAEIGIDINGNNIDAHSNEIYYCNRCIAIGPNVPMSGALVYANHIHDLNVWDEDTGCFYHHDDVHMFPNTGTGSIAGLVFYNNQFDGNQGTGCQDSEITLQGNFTSPIIFNNVCNRQGGDYTQNCIVMFVNPPGQSITNPSVYNNTDLNGSYTNPVDLGLWSEDAYESNITFINNVITGGNQLVAVATGSSFAAGGLDYNIYENILAQGASQNFSYGSNVYQTTLTAWQSATGQDAHAQLLSLASINISSSSGVPQSGSPVIGGGANLYSTCNGQAIPGLGALCYDKPRTVGVGQPTLGYARPTSGAWTAGAYNYVNSLVPSAPSPLLRAEGITQPHPVVFP